MIHYDDSAWPLVLEATPPESSDSDVLEYINRHRSYLAKKTVYGAVLDVRRARTMSVKHRRMLADWINEQRAELQRYHAAVAVVVSPSPIVRGFVSAVYWLSPPPYPYKIMTSIDDAKAWVAKQIDERG